MVPQQFLGSHFLGVPTKDDEYSIVWTEETTLLHCCSYYSWYDDGDNLTRQSKTRKPWVALSSRKNDLT